MKKKTIEELIKEESKTSKEWRDDHETADTRRFMEVQSTITDIYESMPSHIDNSVKSSINTAVNGKIDNIKVKLQENTDTTQRIGGNVKWLMLIGGFLIPLVLGAFAYILQWQVQISNQTAATNSGLQLLEGQLTNSSIKP